MARRATVPALDGPSSPSVPAAHPLLDRLIRFDARVRAWFAVLSGTRADMLGALLVGGIAFAVYLRTMYPGLAGIGDTPKLQFVGAVLGTPHPPGYPVYTLILYLFSHLPFGSIAFRANLVSGVSGAVSVGLCFLVLRRLGVRPWIAASTALGFGLGRLYWSQAILAEVYTMNTAIVLGIVLALLSWARRRTERGLIVAITLFAAACGHHLTSVLLAPVFVLHVVLTDRRQAFARKTLVAAVLLGVLAVAQYGFIWLRTWQRAVFLEARASSVSELSDVLTGREFHRHLGGFDVEKLVDVRLPLFAQYAFEELGPVGLVAAAIGFYLLAKRRWRDALLIGLSFAVSAVFALNYDVYDVDVFFILPLMFAWVAAGFALESFARLERGWQLTMLPSFAVLLAVLMPAWQVRNNLVYNDQSRHEFEDRYFERLIRVLPRNSALLTESYPVDHMMLYKLIGEGRGAARNITLVQCKPEAVRPYLRPGGRPLFAFENCRARLTIKGFQFEGSGLTLARPRNLREANAPDLRPLFIGLSRVVGAPPPSSAPGDSTNAAGK